MKHHESAAPRDSRTDALTVAMDLSRPTDVISADLHARYPRVVGLWWELETDEKSGWVYDSRSYIVTRLVHVGSVTS